MKELHLICNAHLDPVWMWDWEEGLTATLATFYSAVELANEYDYIFCHNEALLYEWVEKYDKNLFDKITELVKQGKWHIMGGWYVQPDCNIPTGESFVRQIESGLTYFNEKFNQRPTVALNFDSFGHTVGLVQILSKCGYDGYLICRPMPSLKDVPLKDNIFNWEGLDGSVVKVVRTAGESLYCTGLGRAVEEIKNKIHDWQDEEKMIILWGVGNHGGGPSRKDLRDIKRFANDCKEDYQVIHSTPEKAFARLNPQANYSNSLQPVLVKCYSSMTRFKQKFAELENMFYLTEKLATLASVQGGYAYDEKIFSEAQKKLSMVQFHDILSGTCVKTGENSAIRKIDYTEELLKEEQNKAFISLIKDDVKADDGDFPIFVFNPNICETKSTFECEILMLQAKTEGEDGYEFDIFHNGEKVPFQTLKEESSINYDRRKRFIVTANLKPTTVERFDIKWKDGKRYRLDKTPQTEFVEKNYGVNFDGNGVLSTIEYNGVNLIDGGIKPVIYEDNPDPWGWGFKTVGKNYTAMQPVIINRITERGEILTEISTRYESGKSFVDFAYRVYKDAPYIDLKVNVCWAEEGKGLKIEIPVKEFADFFGQTAFGIQDYETETEQCAQRYCGVKKDGKCFTVFGKNAFGTSVENGKLYINLFNGSVYCAHPICNFPIIDEDRFNGYIETGSHEFSFRLALLTENELEKYSREFSEGYVYLNYYPHGNGNKHGELCSVTNDAITLTALRKINGKIMIRLLNNSNNGNQSTFTFKNESVVLNFDKFEVKTVIYENGKLTESNSMLVL